MPDFTTHEGVVCWSTSSPSSAVPSRPAIAWLKPGLASAHAHGLSRRHATRLRSARETPAQLELGTVRA